MEITIKLTIEDGQIENVKVEHPKKDTTRITSIYARFFDEGSPYWMNNNRYVKEFLLTKQEWANSLLRGKKKLYLNEVYEMLGIPTLPLGNTVGWIFDKDNPIGDNYVDFGIYNLDIPQNIDFINGYRNTILLDFNVDGMIIDR